MLRRHKCLPQNGTRLRHHSKGVTHVMGGQGSHQARSYQAKKLTAAAKQPVALTGLVIYGITARAQRFKRAQNPYPRPMCLPPNLCSASKRTTISANCRAPAEDGAQQKTAGKWMSCTVEHWRQNCQKNRNKLHKYAAYHQQPTGCTAA